MRKALLARRGLRVQVFEEHARVGDPVHCTGILGTEAPALPGVPRSAVVGWPRLGRFHSPAGRCLSYEGADGEVCIVDRGAFDRSPADAAVAAGVSVEMEMPGRPLVVQAEACLLACGVKYAFQRELGWGVPPLFLSAAQTEVGVAGVEGLDVFLRRDTAPTGFAWLVPISRAGTRRAKLGVMAERHVPGVLGRVLEEPSAAGHVFGPTDPVA